MSEFGIDELGEKLNLKRYVIGFDPGGTDSFGWAVMRSPEAGESCDFSSLKVVAVGISDHSQGAGMAALAAVTSRSGTVTAIGIDAPLTWSETGTRMVDSKVRRAIEKRGCRTSGGTVQHVNSLRGACIVQGILIGRFVLSRFSDAKITETHPKALRFLCREIRASSDNIENEHERDAVISAMSASAMMSSKSGWVDWMKPVDATLYSPLGGCVSYYMPDLE